MSPSNSPTCPRCDAALPAGTTDQLCPACLMSGALEAPGGGGVAVAPGRSPAACGATELPREFGEYRLLAVLGSGGMGTVFEAEQLATGRRVALKMLGQQLDSPEMRQRFLREGRLAASVNHPNSLYVFGSEEIEHIPVITMEIAGSGTLKDKLEKRGPLPVAEAVDAILDVISGLEAAFADGVLHRDVKPSNCFVSPDGSVKVGDFGLSVSTLAKDDSYATATGVVMGTPAYAAPEQLRGDELDVRADIYSVGATLFTLLTGRAPFEGKNAVQVVANAVNQKPRRVSELRADAPPGLDRVVARCLAKEPQGRYDDYMALRNALLPFSSRGPEPASLKVRASAGWVDYLIAFLIPYVPLMLDVGGEEFHVRPFLEHTLYSTRYYAAVLAFVFLYFGLAEGIWGAGLGKRLKGLRVVRTGGGTPGVGRALIRILIPLACSEGVRIPIMLAAISATEIGEMTTANTVLFFVTSIGCPWIAVLMTLTARRENGFATVWDMASGTRVVMEPKGSVRPSIEPAVQPESPIAGTQWLGPYRVTGEILPGKWIVATDPVLRRQVWLFRRTAAPPTRDRRELARPGRLRWLQQVGADEAAWDAFEATAGAPFTELVDGGQLVPWSTLRHWLHDLASELWIATGDGTLPAELSLDRVWVTAQGRAVLLDEPWPTPDAPAERRPAGDVAEQQRFLSDVASCVESTTLPLHARPVLQNLAAGRFERLSFLTGILRGLLNKPVEVSRGIRAGSIFMLPVYVWIMYFVGVHGGEGGAGEVAAWMLAVHAARLVLIGCALAQLLVLPLRTTVSQSIFRLAVVDAGGERARRSALLVRWAIVWLPLFLSTALVAMLWKPPEPVALSAALVLLALWIGAAVHTAMHPNRGLHDRLSGTWVVRL